MADPSAAPVEASPIISTTSILSLLSTLAILATAYTSSLYVLPSSTSLSSTTSSPSSSNTTSTTTKTRILYIWHVFDALIHFLLEGSFLYNCFTVYGVARAPLTPPLLPNGVFWLRGWVGGGVDGGHEGRLYGAAYGTGAMSRLWQEYGRADARWAGVDLTVVSLEILTVCVAGPMAVWVAMLLARGDRRWVFWGSVLATMELYGGFMTFAPEWLTGSPNLDTSHFMYLWVYLFFFNTLWVWFPLWVLYEAYVVIVDALSSQSRHSASMSKRSH